MKRYHKENIRNTQMLIEGLESRTLFSTFVVNRLSDRLTPISGCMTLRQAIVQANDTPGDNTITFDPALFLNGGRTISLKQGQLRLANVTGRTTLTGPWASELTIDAGQKSRVMRIARGVTATISGLTIKNGEVGNIGGSPRGAGIRSAGNLQLDGVWVTENSITPDLNSDLEVGAGGGIYSSGSLSISNSSISGNSVAGLSNSGGGIYSIGSMEVSSSLIEHNYAKGNGGGIDCGGGTLTITDSFIRKNQAFYGGGISGKTVVMARSVVNQNSSNASGGGVQAQDVTFTQDTIFDNKITFETDPNFQAFGGGLACADGDLKNCIVSSNTVVGVLFDTSLNDTEPTLGGGGIYCTGSLTLKSSSVTSNTATGVMANVNVSWEQLDGGDANGGGIFVLGNLNLSNCDVSSNLAQGGDADHIHLTNDAGGIGGSTLGGGIYSTGTISIVTSTLNNNQAAGGYAAMVAGINYSGSAAGGAIYSTGATVSLVNSTLVGNSAVGAAGSEGSDPYDGFSTGGNGGNAVGGAIDASITMIANCTVSGNMVVPGPPGLGQPPRAPYGPYQGYRNGSPGSAEGSGIVTSTPVLITNSIIASNSGADEVVGTVSANSAYDLFSQSAIVNLTNNVNGIQLGVTNPGLGPLSQNGGIGLTMVPLPGSPAIDAGSNTLIPSGVTSDGRGLPRIYNSTVDVGAVEVQPAATISGSIFLDSNGDGILDGIDAVGGVMNERVYIDLNNDGMFEANEPSVLVNYPGTWSFQGIPPGTFTVRVVPIAGEIVTAPALGSFTFGVGPNSVRAGNLFGIYIPSANG